MEVEKIAKIEKYIGVAEDVCSVVKNGIRPVLEKSDKRLLMVFAGLSLAASVLATISQSLNSGEEAANE